MSRKSQNRSLLVRTGCLALGLAVAVLAVVQTSSAAFTAEHSNGTNTFAAGTVLLATDDTHSLLFHSSDMVPGESETNCITVIYTGSSFNVTDVHFYATETTNVDNFADHLDITVRMGTGGSFGDCTGFTPASTIASEPLSTLTSTHTDFASGVPGYTPTTGSTSRVYEITVTLGADTPNSAQDDSASAEFIWEIQSA